MEKTKSGAAAALTALLALPAGAAVAHAAPAPTQALPPAASYAELLEPIPNASERLRLADAEAASAAPRMILAQYDVHNHHHHYYRRWRRYRRHHHHHHHHHNHY